MRFAFSAVAGIVLALGMLPGADNKDSPGIPARGTPLLVFNGANLNQFDTFVPSKGLNNDTDHIFTVENGAIHVSGQEYGFVVTKQEYTDFYLTAEFKWGEGTYAQRAGKARDAGILYEVTGEYKVWPSSVEFQMMEGGTGDIYLCNGFALTNAKGDRVIGGPGRYVGINRFGKGAWKDETGYRDPNGDPERPHGEWNRVDLVVQDGRARYYVNEKLVNEASDLVVTKGKILFQSEGAEVFYRNIGVYALP